MIDSNMQPNMQHAETFLTRLAEGAVQFTFQTFDDQKDRKNPELTRMFHGSLDQHFPELVSLNLSGAGIFVTVNETDFKGRKTENIVAIRAVFQEADRTGVPIPALTPHIVVQTSPGKFHRYWLTHGGADAMREFKQVMATMVREYGSDPNAKDVSRVLRLPGFFHQKEPTKPFMVEIVETSDALPFKWSEVTNVITPAVGDEVEREIPSSTGFLKDALKIYSALIVLDPDCNYQKWLSIGMALHHASDGESHGYRLWDEWSAKGGCYREGETAYKWSSFGKYSGDPVTIGTLYHFGSEVGWDWNLEHQRSVLEKAIEIIETVIDSSADNPAAYLKDEAIQAFGVVKSCDSPMFESLRMRLKQANPKIRISKLDDFVESSGFGSPLENPTEELVRLTCEYCELWHDPAGIGYVSFDQEHDGGKHKEHWEIDSTGFGEWLAKLAHTELKIAPSGETINTVKNTLNGRAKFDGMEYEVFLRIGKDESGYWIDLGDTYWQAVCVGPAGWRVSSSPSVRFVRTKATRPLPMPSKSGDIDPLWSLVNIPVDDRILILTWVLECYRCDTPYPVLEITGEQGSAKSSTQTVLRSLIDPNQVMLRGRPKNVEDIYVSAKNNHLLSYENLSHITNDISDALCTVATGGGTAGRTLYTNDEETILEAHNPVILNGIGVIVIRQDLLDRSISVCLPNIEQRRTEQDLKKNIDQQLSTIFGGLLSLLGDSLNALPSVEIPADDLPRMADFAKLGEAMSRAMGHTPGTWLNMYSEHRKNSIRRTIDSSAVAVECLKLVESGQSFHGTVKKLLEKLNTARLSPTEEKDYWPKTPRGLADQLRRIAPGMRLLGVHLSVENKPRRDGVHCELKIIPGAFQF